MNNKSNIALGCFIGGMVGDAVASAFNENAHFLQPK